MANIRRRSIELEPRTLNQGQLFQAKKVAADVVQKMEPREASSLFTEGVEHSVKEVKKMDEDGEKVDEKEVGMDEIEVIGEQGCMSSSSSSAMVDSPDQLHIHQNEPLSAPF